MNRIRTAMTAFLSIVVILSFFGWRWAGSLPSPKIEAARMVLALGSLASLGAIFLIWKEKSQGTS